MKGVQCYELFGGIALKNHTFSFFIFNGTAMVSKMAQLYANSFMHYVEKPTAYFRYIDDILLIWPHGIDALETFIENANRTHPYIDITLEYSTTAVAFLNVIIKINNGIISTTHKNTDNHRYLHYTSCHSMHTKNSIIFHSFSDTKECVQTERILSNTAKI